VTRYLADADESASARATSLSSTVPLKNSGFAFGPEAYRIVEDKLAKILISD